MTITYTISECKREVEAYTKKLDDEEQKFSYPFKLNWLECYRENLERWGNRLIEATEQLTSKQTRHLELAAFYRKQVGASYDATPPIRWSIVKERAERRSIDQGHRRWHLQKAWAIRLQLKSL